MDGDEAHSDERSHCGSEDGAALHENRKDAADSDGAVSGQLATEDIEQFAQSHFVFGNVVSKLHLCVDHCTHDAEGGSSESRTEELHETNEAYTKRNEGGIMRRRTPTASSLMPNVGQPLGCL